MKNVNRKINLILMLFLVVSLKGTSMDVGAQYNFHGALNYAFSANIDTIVLTTSGGIYTTPEVTVADSQQFVIYEPIVIMAASGLAERPIFTHPNGGGSTSKEIFRILNDVEFIGVNFMGGIDETQGCKYGLRFGDYIDLDGVITRGKEGTVMKFNDCHFEGFHSLKDQNMQGNVLFFKRPEDNNLTLTNLRNTSVIFENCSFKDIGDEAIRISEGEKYDGGDGNGVVACSLLVVRNCTFDDIDAECIRIYADKDTSQAGDTYVDGTLIADHITVVNSAPRFIYAKNFRNATVTNVLVAYGRETSINRPDRGDFTMQVQLSGSTISYVDTFDLEFTLPLPSSGRISATKGGYVNTNTVFVYDPIFVDYANGDYTLAEGSPLYGLGSDGEAIGDLRWATNPSMAIEEDNLPKRFRLSQNYPNPFNPQTTIDFYLNKSGEVSLKIYDLEGRFITSPINGFKRSGHHSIRFDGKNLSNGIYFYQLQSGDEVSLRKMLLVK
jgi:hypothetical protein